ncbi:MAG: hypothetical protein ACO1OG_01415 [Devosia sp.]
MTFNTVARLAGVLLIGASLAGCMDVVAEMEVTSETTGKATTTMTMGADIYPMIKQAQEAAGEDASTEDAFCVEEGDVLVENADGGATCTTIKEGTLEEIISADGPNEGTVFEVVSPGVVRVSMKTEEMSSGVTEGQDEQTMAMMKAYFEGRTATIRIKGKKIVETNMTQVDGSTAETVIQFTDLFDGTADLPPELYAIVDAN